MSIILPKYVCSRHTKSTYTTFYYNIFTFTHIATVSDVCIWREISYILMQSSSYKVSVCIFCVHTQTSIHTHTRKVYDMIMMMIIMQQQKKKSVAFSRGLFCVCVCVCSILYTRVTF